MSSVREAYLRASSFLEERNVSEARRSAEMLLMHVLGVPKARLLAMWNDPVDEAARDRLWELVQRRAAGEPVQYIIGETYFCGRRFAVDRSVLIPRPETELLVERVLAAGDDLWGGKAAGTADAAGADGTKRGPLLADLGTGSGAIAVSLAASRPAWRIAASDISGDALRTARRNAEAHGVEGRIAFLEGDWLAPVAAAFRPGEVDAVVANPPYIPSAECAGLQIEVRGYEPRLALDGGEDGMAPYRRILEQMTEFGIWPQLAAFECGLGQAQKLAGMLRETGFWTDVDIVNDFAGIERHVIAFRRKID